VLAAFLTLPEMAFAVVISRIAAEPIPVEQTSEPERIGLEALNAAIGEFFGK